MDDLGGMTEEEQIEMAIRMSMQQDAAPQEEPMATEGNSNHFVVKLRKNNIVIGYSDSILITSDPSEKIKNLSLNNQYKIPFKWKPEFFHIYDRIN